MDSRAQAMDPTAEGPLQLSDSCRDLYSLLETLEETAPELFMPPTAQVVDSQQEFILNQAMASSSPTLVASDCSNSPRTVLDRNSTTFPAEAHDELSGHLSETSSPGHEVTSSEQRKPTATWVADGNDNSRASFADGHRTAIPADSTMICYEGHQVKALGGDRVLYEDQMTFRGDRTHYAGQTTSGGNQSHDGGHMTFGGNQARGGGQVKNLRDGQPFYGGQVSSSGNRTHCGGQMASERYRVLWGVRMNNCSDGQTFHGGQMAALRGGFPMTFTTNDPTFLGGQTTHSGGQTLYGSQMATLPLQADQKTTVRDPNTPCGSHRMRPCQSSSLPRPGLSSVSDDGHQTKALGDQPTLCEDQAALSGDQTLRGAQDSKRETQPYQFPNNRDTSAPYPCAYQGCGKSYSRRARLQIHERTHTGERPYKCSVEGCTWAFTRSDELKRHSKRHSGERPYLCTLCNASFARSDHLKQHQRVHNPGRRTHQPRRK